ncbi:MAG TPA: tyrosine-type recombinase/integrase [Frankiaceae bacterium]|nr:tyrosine-type recombinase/integrase [Frankiaceae bacterium]
MSRGSNRKEPGLSQRHGKTCPRKSGGRPRACECPWEYRLDIDGGRNNRHQERKGGFADKESAKRARDERAAALLGRPGDAHRMTVGQYLDVWLAGKVRLRPTTRESYTDYIERLLKPAIGSVKLSELERDPQIVERLFRDLAVRPNRHGRTMSPATLRRVHAMLRAALNKAVRTRYLVFNPALAVELPEVPRPKITVWTAEETIDFLDYLDGDAELGRKPERLRALYHLALVTGMRRGEVLGQRWEEDVDLDALLTTVAEQRVRTRDGVIVGAPKTKAGERPVTFDAGTGAVLAQHRAEQDAERAAWGAAWTDTGLVFTNEDGTALSPDFVSRRFQALCRKAGVPVIRLHDLRHTSATLGLLAGVSIKAISARVGHSSSWFTADRYVHVDHAVARDAADRIAQVVSLDSRRRVPVTDEAPVAATGGGVSTV